MKLTAKMQEFIDLLQKGHKGWYSWTAKRVKCHIYINADNPEQIVPDEECLTHSELRLHSKEFHSSTVAGLLERGLIEGKTVDYTSERFGLQTFSYYGLKATYKNRTCRINRECCDSAAESMAIYNITSEPNANGRVDIESVNFDWPVKPIESIDIRMITII